MGETHSGACIQLVLNHAYTHLYRLHCDHLLILNHKNFKYVGLSKPVLDG